MSFISALIPNLCVEIIHSWLGLKEISHLDMAFCFHDERLTFLKLLSHPHFKHDVSLNQTNASDCIQWFASRRVHVGNVVWMPEKYYIVDRSSNPPEIKVHDAISLRKKLVYVIYEQLEDGHCGILRKYLSDEDFTFFLYNDATKKSKKALLSDESHFSLDQIIEMAVSFGRETDLTTIVTPDKVWQWIDPSAAWRKKHGFRT